MTILSITTIVLYLASSSRLAISLFRDEEGRASARQQTLILGFLGLVCHLIILYNSLISGSQLNLGFYNSASLVSWVIVLTILVAAMKKPVENLALIFLPIGAIAVLLAMLFPSQRLAGGSSELGLNLHILLSIVAYSLLSIAALQAILLAIQDRQLRHKHPVSIMQILPPLTVMEEFLFQLIAAGFLCLSLSLVSGIVFLQDIFAQHLVHKTFLSILAWFTFAILLWGRINMGWRGHTAIRWTLGGFIFLMLAYFGTKLVLELILHKI